MFIFGLTAALLAPPPAPLFMDGCIQNMACEGEGPGLAQVKSFGASSTLADKKHRYRAEHLIDEDEGTAWCEGVKGDGVGTEISFEFRDPQSTAAVLVSPMYAKSLALMRANNRVKRFSLQLDNDPPQSFAVDSYTFNECAPTDCTSLNAPLIVTLPKPRTVSRLRLKILEVERGQKFRDTCMSTLRLLAPEP